nr:MAG TPA: hypothetical protein [Caudoviricetes sp.]
MKIVGQRIVNKLNVRWYKAEFMLYNGCRICLANH